MKKIIKFTVIVLHLFVWTACSDYLDIKSNNRLAVPNTLQDLQALLDNAEVMNIYSTPSYLESATDNYFLTDSRYSSTPEQQKPLYEWLPVDYGFQNDWSISYQLVYNANFCFDMLNEIEVTAETKEAWNNVYGSALFFRAYSYLGLLWVYADTYNPSGGNDKPGIVLRASSDFNIPSKRSTLQEGYDQVIEDLEAAIAYLPEKPLVKTRPSKWAAYALLARAYLSMSDYRKAEIYADLCLEIDDTLMDYNNPDDGILIDANVPFNRFTKETIFYSDMAVNFRLHVPTTGSYVDTVLYKSYDDNDLRKTAFFRSSEAYFRFKGSYSHSSNWLFSGLTTAEMQLIKMECLARESKSDDTLMLLKHFLKFRWDKNHNLPDFGTLSTGEVLDVILKERRKELIMRGLRLADIKRLNLEGYNIVLRRKIGDRLVEVPPNSDRLVLNLPPDIVRYFE